MEHQLTNKLTCLCCGKVSRVVSGMPNVSDALVECGHCGYEHVVEIRAGAVARVRTTGEGVDPRTRKIVSDWCCIEV